MHKALPGIRSLPTKGRGQITAVRLPLAVLILLSLLPAGCGSPGAVRKTEELPPCVVTDIDRTITDGRFRMRTAHKVPLPSAQEALREIEADGVKIIYLSKRLEWKRAETVEWLKLCGFPRGEEIILKKTKQEDGAAFKLRKLAEIRKKFYILYGFGNPDDGKIYRRAGIKSIIRDPWRDEDWAKVSKNVPQILEQKWRELPRKERSR